MGKSIRQKQAAELLGIGRSTFWRWVKERNDFPKPRRLSARCTVFDHDEIIAWRDSFVPACDEGKDEKKKTRNPRPRTEAARAAERKYLEKKRILAEIAAMPVRSIDD